MKTTIKNIIQSRQVAAGALVAVLVFSLLVFLFGGPLKKRVLLFFPTDDFVTVAGDYHIVPRKESREENMKVLLAESLLEPLDYHLNETVPEGVSLQSFIYDREKEVLYVDLSLEMVSVDDDPAGGDGDRMLEILEKNLRFNFTGLEEVKFTIDGQVPHSYVFNESFL